MSDLGDPIAYEGLERHTPVFSADGEEIGTVDHVLADEREDVFDGIVIRRPQGHRHTHSFAEADQIAAIHEHGVTLKLGTDEAETLPAPSPNPGIMTDDPTQKPYSPLHSKLLRAWDWVSGNY